MTTLYTVLAIILSLATATAIFRGRALGWLVPVWFLVSIATTELAPWVLALLLGFILLGVVFLDPTATTFPLFLLTVSALAMLEVLRRHLETGRHFERALATGLADDFEQKIPLQRRQRLSRQIDAADWTRPFTFARASVQLDSDISYGPAGKRNMLDVYRPMSAGEGRPVLLQIHGGAWFLGHKREQALPLLYHMASLGWVCVSINYRLSPSATFPDHIIDVKKAIAWIRENIHAYGGDPNFIAVTGGSAGGHLTSLAALSGNYPAWQPGFESVDTRVQAAMPLYACFDFRNRFDIRYNNTIDAPIARSVMKITEEEDPEAWDRGSPVTWVHEDAPPFFVVQGTHDTLIWVEEARRFVAELSAVSRREIVYAELPGAQHSFDIPHSPRTSHWLNAAALWLEWAYADWRDGDQGHGTDPDSAG